MKRSFFIVIIVLIFCLLKSENQSNEIASQKEIHKLDNRLVIIDSLKKQLDDLVDINSSDRTRISYTFFDCFSNKTISSNGDQIKHAASSFKTFLAAYCFYLVDQKELDINFLNENANSEETKTIINHINNTHNLNKIEKANDTRNFISKFDKIDLIKMLFLSDKISTTRIISKLPNKLDGLNDFIRNILDMKNSFIISWSNGETKYNATIDKKIPLVNGRHNTLTTNDQTKAWKKLFIEKSIIKDSTLKNRLLELLMYSYYSPMKEGLRSKIIASKHGKITYSAWGGNRPHSVLNDGGLIFNKDGEPMFIFHIQINDYPDLITGEEIIERMANTVSLYLEYD